MAFGKMFLAGHGGQSNMRLVYIVFGLVQFAVLRKKEEEELYIVCLVKDVRAKISYSIDFSGSQRGLGLQGSGLKNAGLQGSKTKISGL